VVLDNASTDGTADAIAQALGGRVPILTRQNPTLLPQTANWNTAYKMVPGDARYIKLLCADDLMRADCIKRMVAVAESDPGVNFVTATDVFDDRVKPHGLDPARTVFDGREIARRLVQRNLHWMPFHHAFFRAEAIRHSYFYHPNLEHGCDRDLVVRLLLGGRMGFVNAPLLYTRYHENTLTATLAAEDGLLCCELAELRRYGSELMASEELSRQHKIEMRIILRHVLYQMARGQPAVAAKLLVSMADLGIEPAGLDYVASVLTWPAHLTRKKMRQAAYRSVTPATTITEADFVGLPDALPALADA
jgi:glycosyltransferase involved in cell wall biosynthesis